MLWALTVMAAGLNRGGRQRASLRPHAQHHAAPLVQVLGGGDVTLGGGYADAGGHVGPRADVEPEKQQEGGVRDSVAPAHVNVRRRERFPPAVLNRVGDIGLCGRRGPAHQPVLHTDVVRRRRQLVAQRCEGTQTRTFRRELGSADRPRLQMCSRCAAVLLCQQDDAAALLHLF